jgi:hypothetical protein
MIKFKNGREVKAGDPVVGKDWRDCRVEGTAVKGDAEKGHPSLVFQHGVHKTVCPSLALSRFLHADDDEKTVPPAPATAAA